MRTGVLVHAFAAALLLLSGGCAARPGAGGSPGAAPVPVPSSPLGMRLDGLVSQYHESGRFNGVALVAQGGEVILLKGYGWADLKDAAACRPGTQFRIGSITKTFTAVRVLQLVEAGRADLDSPVADLLPYYRKDTGRRVTLRHLLSHTCGLPNFLTREGFVEAASGEHLTTREFVEKYCMEDLEFEPGTRQKYTNTGFVILGAIVEELTHRPFQASLREDVLAPAGLRSTTWGGEAPRYGRVAGSYERAEDGRMSPTAPLRPDLLGAAGALSSTAEDLFRWDRALASGRLLTEEMARRMYTPVMGNYALGWNVKTLPVGPDHAPRTLVGHDGGISGHLTHFLRIPEDGVVIVLLSNAWDNDYRSLSGGILDILYGRRPEPPPA